MPSIPSLSTRSSISQTNPNTNTITTTTTITTNNKRRRQGKGMKAIMDLQISFQIENPGAVEDDVEAHLREKLRL